MKVRNIHYFYLLCYNELMLEYRVLVGGLVAVTLFSGFALSSSSAAAETYTRDALVRVSSACTMTGGVSDLHTRSVPIATYASDIGETTLSTVCNDNGGFAVYAIGYTGNVDGTNTLVHGTNSNKTIATGLTTSGNVSSWAMRLAAVQNGGSTPTIENGYSSYSVVPNSYIKVVSYSSATALNTSVSFKTYYAVYVSPTQAAGTYTGQVKYVLVHPSAATPS